MVTATRVERNPLSIPLAISTVSGDDVQRRQLLGLDESMARVPGVYITNRYNDSRDLRISIRGFGARSNFGVRGMKIYVDGIPSTAPNGQTALDGLDLANVNRIYNWRDFYARLPFAASGTTTFERFFYGGGQYSNASALGSFANRVTVGIDVDHMTDDRRRFDNLNGQQGPLGFEQDEEADTVGLYLQDDFALHEQVDLQAGLRYDHVELAIDDRFLANGDQSATLEFDEINWMVGAV